MCEDAALPRRDTLHTVQVHRGVASARENGGVSLTTASRLDTFTCSQTNAPYCVCITYASVLRFDGHLSNQSIRLELEDASWCCVVHAITWKTTAHDMEWIFPVMLPGADPLLQQQLPRKTQIVAIISDGEQQSAVYLLFWRRTCCSASIGLKSVSCLVNTVYRVGGGHLLHREWLATPGLLQGFPALSLAQTRGATEPAKTLTPVRAKLSIPESMWHDDWPLHQDEAA
ncbi:hypothetical protein M441DRAFT_457249 [Trichoderma asperellum CBS 433.97]|uniref:Uncharacterized protein n=1 Tax=Trichoderma asperellum (strain ATCC 204424 / CBS 433.97 / NBRC 101777) TaxID=1042311 RepID=A0A2T3Z9D8_TRIA4|nr:hypothetical protein M441DRAFT_457249 [Trichoderma asperellum CBS 433.97]PTB41400.1 hypothetical protein M441DRAFT_457249 [Trichoderma asperellum CBS 433.97]